MFQTEFLRREKALSWPWDLCKPSDDLPAQENNQNWTVYCWNGSPLYTRDMDQEWSIMGINQQNQLVSKGKYTLLWKKSDGMWDQAAACLEISLMGMRKKLKIFI